MEQRYIKYRKYKYKEEFYGRLIQYPLSGGMLFLNMNGNAYIMEEKDLAMIFIHVNAPSKIRTSKQFVPKWKKEGVIEHMGDHPGITLAYIRRVDDNYELVIKDPTAFIPILNGVDTSKLWTIKDFMNAYGLNDESWVRRLCKSKRILGAVKIGRIWYMPKGAEYPKTKRKYNKRQDRKI